MDNKIFLYYKHPPHNLDGEDYPHFRSGASGVVDKNLYENKFVNKVSSLSVNVQVSTFDTGSITINNSDPNADLFNLTGLKETRGDRYTRYWFVVGWDRAVRTDAITFQLKLDYWMTWWPLTFNAAQVTITRRHAPAIFQNALGSWTIDLNNKVLHPAFYNEEEISVDNGFNIETWPVSLIHPTDWELYKIIVMNGEAEGHSFDAPDQAVKRWPLFPILVGNKFQTNDNKSLNYDYINGVVFFAPEIAQWGINNFSNDPNCTNSGFLYLNSNKITIFSEEIILNNDIKYNVSGKNEYWYWDYDNTATTTLDIKTKLLAEKFALTSTAEENDERKIYAYYYLMTLFWLNGGTDPTNDNTCYLNCKSNWDENHHVDYLMNFKGLKSLDYDPNLSLIPIKLTYTDINAYHKVQRPIYYNAAIKVTEINILNNFLNQNKPTMRVLFDLRKFLVGKKSSKWFYTQELKCLTKHCQFWLTQNQEFSEINLGLMAEDPLDAQLTRFNHVQFEIKQFVSLNDIFIWYVPHLKRTDARQLFSWVTTNTYQSWLASDTALKFFQSQGQSYQTGLNQAKYNYNFAKKYGALGIATQTIGAALGVGASAFGASQAEGKNALMKKRAGYAGAAGAAAASTLGIFSGIMSYHNKLKNMEYGIKRITASMTDATTNPAQTNYNNELELKRVMTQGVNGPWPAVQVYGPSPTMMENVAKFYHKNGHACHVWEKIDFNNSRTRAHWNFWRVSNIEQALVKDHLPRMVIDYFNVLFNRGVRLWNEFNNVEMYDYSKNNTQFDYYQTLPD